MRAECIDQPRLWWGRDAPAAACASLHVGPRRPRGCSLRRRPIREDGGGASGRICRPPESREGILGRKRGPEISVFRGDSE